MTREEAIRQIILDYCESNNILLTQFAKKCNISKSYMSKINLKQFGKIGISMTYLELIAKGLNMSMIDLQILIEKYQNCNHKNRNETKKELILSEINDKLRSFSNEDLEVLHSIISNVNHKNLNILHSFLKNMQWHIFLFSLKN